MTTEKNHFSTQSFSDRQGETEGELSVPPVQFWLGPYNEGGIDRPDSIASVTGPCGDTMEISLRIHGNMIVESRFRVNGCAVSRTCASIAASLAEGKELEEAWDIDEKMIIKTMQTIPEDDQHCAILARDTLRQAIEQYVNPKKNIMAQPSPAVP
jgi:nitrogen fixation protein NifU and related proteins